MNVYITIILGLSCPRKHHCQVRSELSSIVDDMQMWSFGGTWKIVTIVIVYDCNVSHPYGRQMAHTHRCTQKLAKFGMCARLSIKPVTSQGSTTAAPPKCEMSVKN